MSTTVENLLMQVLNEMAAFRAETKQEFIRIEKRFEEVDRRFEAIDRRFEAIDQRFEAIDQRFVAIDVRFDRLEREMGAMGARLDQIERDMAEGFISLGNKIFDLRVGLDAVIKKTGTVVPKIIRYPNPTPKPRY